MATINGLRLYPEGAIQDIASMIRRGNGTNNTYKLSQMPSAISALSNTGGDANQLYTILTAYNSQASILSYSSNSSFTSIKPFLFYDFRSSSFSSISYPNVTYIGDFAFYYCWSLNSVYLPNCTQIGSQAFAYCSNLSSINLSKVITINNGGLRNCSNLQSINLDSCEVLGPYALYSTKLTSISLPNCSFIDERVFGLCSTLTSISAPKASFLGSYVFTACSSLTSIYLPSCLEIGACAFDRCTALSYISIPNVKKIGVAAFGSCTNLTSIILPKVTTLSPGGVGANGTFESCINLHTVDFQSSIEIIGSYCFAKCYNLLSLYLRGSSVCQLDYYGYAFSSTPIYNYTTSTGGVYGSVFVPESLVSAYKSATNWAYISSRITAIT